MQGADTSKNLALEQSAGHSPPPFQALPPPDLVSTIEPLLLLLLSRFSRVRLFDPIDGSPPGSPVPGILQARTLERVAISFSNA